MLEKMYVEDYGLTRYELGDAAVIKKSQIAITS